MEDEYVGDNIFIECLNDMKRHIEEGKFSDMIKEEIYETLQSYIKGEHRLDPETVKCLFTGYYLRKMMKDHGDKS